MFVLESVGFDKNCCRGLVTINLQCYTLGFLALERIEPCFVPELK